MTGRFGSVRLKEQRIWLAWGAIAAGLLTLALVLVAHRHRFDWTLSLPQIPALPLMTGLVLAGVVFVLLPPLVQATARAALQSNRGLLALTLAVGVVLRLLMFTTEPALEDDQQRYLWEGALVAHGFSPYRIAPDDAKAADRATLLGKIAERSAPVLERVNHPALTTIYPPVAQAAFALAHLLSPFNLTAWRLLLLVADGVTLWLLLRLLADCGRTPLWSVLYWWNPLVIKEVFNSAHMEGVLIPLVVGAVLLSGRRRFMAASATLGLAIGVKVWPVLLVPLLLRPLAMEPRRTIGPLSVLAALCALWAWPILAGGLGPRSGFVAYAGDWQANSALLPALRDTLGQSLALVLPGIGAGQIARLILAACAVLIALWLSRDPWRTPRELVERVALFTLALLLLSPAQFPWYALWTLPFLPLAPRLGVSLLAVTMPLYYASFYFASIGQYEVFRDKVVWAVWLPIWLLLGCEAWRNWRNRRMERPSDSR